jgi:hypothetical protein
VWGDDNLLLSLSLDLNPGFVTSTLVTDGDMGLGTLGYAGYSWEDDGSGVMYWGVAPNAGFITEDLTVAVAPVPVPAAAWLLGSGLLGLIGIRRRSH